MRSQLNAAFIHQTGATLIVALIFLLVLTIAGVTAMRFSTFEERMASNTQFRNQVFQQTQNELRSQLLAFNASLANRAPLLAAMNQPRESVENLAELPMLPSSSRQAVLLTPITGAQTADNTVRFTREVMCDDGSSIPDFVCMDFELNAKTELESGTYSWQTQGIMFQNNK
ncbi:PilX N-terminal domain-containing pilus assembly protein [Pseudomonas sp.]|jgi:Tfp pilus assembly protein PilX|uniref:pilus assembly PilX family protein n=1 Tax=Pseudomonas sp. TaxID=306 RepID=UPI0037C9304E